MAAFQPVEDAGSRLAFGIVRLLRVFVTAASPGVVAETPLRDQYAVLGLFQSVQANSGAGWNDDFQGPLRKKKGFQEIFLLDKFKTGTRIRAGFPWAGSIRCWNGKFR